MIRDLDIQTDADDAAETLAVLRELLTDPDLSSAAVHLKCLEHLDGPGIAAALARLRRQQKLHLPTKE
jgi:hypothetical protein